MNGSKSASLWATLTYVLLVAPLGPIVRLLRDPLRTRRPRNGTNWVQLPPEDPSLERARRLG